MWRFRRAHPEPHARGHVRVTVDSQAGVVSEVEILSPLLTHEVQPVLAQALQRAFSAMREGRRARIDALLKESGRHAGVWDRVRKGPARRIEEAGQAIEAEHFCGAAGAGMVSVVLDGNLMLVELLVQQGAQDGPALAMCLEALGQAEQACLARWRNVAEGHAHQAKALPAAGSTSAAQVPAPPGGQTASPREDSGDSGEREVIPRPGIEPTG